MLKMPGKDYRSLQNLLFKAQTEVAILPVLLTLKFANIKDNLYIMS